VLWWLRKRVGEVNFCGRRELTGVERKEEERVAVRCEPREEVDEDARSSATSPRPQAGEQLRGWARGGAGRSSSAPAAVHPPSARVL